jgi:flagellar L-ring protein precursor FlgH
MMKHPVSHSAKRLAVPARTALVYSVLSLTGAGLAGCVSQPPLVPTKSFAPVYPTDPVAPRQNSGSIYNESQTSNFFGRQRDYRVGDLITVLLDERPTATRNLSSTLSRVGSNTVMSGIQQSLADGAKASGLPFSKGISGVISAPTLSGSTITSTGSGAGGQLTTLTGSIAVTVVEVMSNGNLVVRGEKQLALSEGSETIQVSGTVRVEDVAPNGTVQSKRLANAQIAYRGDGDMSDATKAGWGNRILFKWWPF